MPCCLTNVASSTASTNVFIDNKGFEGRKNFLVFICCLKVFDVIYPFAFDDVKLNKLDANLLDFVAYISVELVIESIGRVCFLNERSNNPRVLSIFSGLLSCPLSCPVLR